MPTRALLSLLVVVAVSACATAKPHTEIPPAPVDGSFEERRAYFKEHDLDSREGDHLFLHGGKRVYYPEDLRPAVADGSPTAKAIDEHLEVKAFVEAWQPYFWIVQGTGAVGGAVLLGGMMGLFFPVFDPSLSDLGATVVLGGLVGGLVLMGASLVGILGWQLVFSEESDAFAETADRAWRTYPQALTDNVGVGVNADGILFDLRAAPAEPAKPANVFGVGGLGVGLGEVDETNKEKLDEPAADDADPADAPPPPPPIEEDIP